MVKLLLRLLLAIGVVIVVLVINLIVFSNNAQKISEGVPINNADPERVALLVIDIQEGTTGTASAIEAYKEQAGDFISEVNEVIKKSETRGLSLIYIKSEVVNPLINVLNNTLARGSEGAAFDKRLLMKPGHVITKRKNDPFRETDLDQILTGEGIGKLVLVGLDAGECVTATCQAAQNRGYLVAVVEQAVIAKTETLKKEALNSYVNKGVEIISSY